MSCFVLVFNNETDLWCHLGKGSLCRACLSCLRIWRLAPLPLLRVHLISETPFDQALHRAWGACSSKTCVTCFRFLFERASGWDHPNPVAEFLFPRVPKQTAKDTWFSADPQLQGSAGPSPSASPELCGYLLLLEGPPTRGSQTGCLLNSIVGLSFPLKDPSVHLC